MIDQDSDRWVFEVLAPDLRRKMKNLKDQHQWTDLVAQSLREAHDRGITKEQILHTLRTIPFHPAMVRAVTKLKDTGTTTFLCLSNANSVFIPNILEDNGLATLFDEIITNPAEWDPSGLLKLHRRVDPQGPQHSCSIGCQPNMCKGWTPYSSFSSTPSPIAIFTGEELTAYLHRKAVEFDRIAYVGDGTNDFCPILRLRSQDMVFCRTGRGLQKRIGTEGEQQGLKCSVHLWGGAWEIEEHFNKLL